MKIVYQRFQTLLLRNFFLYSFETFDPDYIRKSMNVLSLDLYYTTLWFFGKAFITKFVFQTAYFNAFYILFYD